MSASKTRLPRPHCQALHTSSHIMHSTITLSAQLYSPSHNGRFLPFSTTAFEILYLEGRASTRYNCDNYRVSGALEKLEHETILQDRASDR